MINGRVSRELMTSAFAPSYEPPPVALAVQPSCDAKQTLHQDTRRRSDPCHFPLLLLPFSSAQTSEAVSATGCSCTDFMSRLSPRRRTGGHAFVAYVRENGRAFGRSICGLQGHADVGAALLDSQLTKT